jgi:hypothetical protein
MPMTRSRHLEAMVPAVRPREQADRQGGLKLATTVREYVQRKRRAKDGLPLKARTQADYLAMLQTGKTSAAGKK